MLDAQDVRPRLHLTEEDIATLVGDGVALLGPQSTEREFGDWMGSLSERWQRIPMHG